MTQKIVQIKSFFIIKYFFVQNTFKVILQCSFNLVTLLSNVFNLKHNFKLQIDQKTFTFKTLEEIQKTWKKLLKTTENPDYFYRKKEKKVNANN